MKRIAAVMFAQLAVIVDKNKKNIVLNDILSFRCTLMILHLSRMRRNAHRKVYNDRKNVSAAPLLDLAILYLLLALYTQHLRQYR